MKYCYLTIYDNQLNLTKYTVPVLANNRIYGAMDTTRPNERVLYNESPFTYSEDEWDKLVSSLSLAIDFNPVTLGNKNHLINTAGYEDEYIYKYINKFGGDMEEWNYDHAYVYPYESTGGRITIGYNYLGPNSNNNGRATNSLFGAYQASGRIIMDAIQRYTENVPQNEFHVNHLIKINPEKFISNKKFDFDAFTKISESSVRVWTCTLLIDVWWNYTDSKWRYKIYTIASDYDLSSERGKLQDKEIEKVYNNQDPNDKPPDDGGPGGYPKPDDTIDPPDLPDIDPSSLGAFQIFKVDNSQVKVFFDYLKSNEPGPAIMKWFQNPIQGLISMFTVPYPILNTAGQSIKILGLDTGAVGGLCPMFQKFENVGTIQITASEICNNFLSFAPYSTASIFLPYIGMRPLDIDEILDKTIRVSYMMDNSVGGVIAYITIDDSVRYTFSGNCASQVPVSQQNWGQSYIAAATTAATVLAGGVGGAAKAIGSTSSGLLGAAAKGVGGFVGGAALQAGSSLGNLQAPSISRSGSISGSAGMMSVRDIYLVIEYPDPDIPSNFSSVVGFTSNKGVHLSSLSGYQVIGSCHLNNINATGPELDEIEQLLHEGVIF